MHPLDATATNTEAFWCTVMWSAATVATMLTNSGSKSVLGAPNTSHLSDAATLVPMRTPLGAESTAYLRPPNTHVAPSAVESPQGSHWQPQAGTQDHACFRHAAQAPT